MTAVPAPARTARTSQAAVRHRVFFALWGTERFCQQLGATVAPMLTAVPGRPVVPADWHVTLCFLGEVDGPVLGSLQTRAGQLDARGFVLQFDAIEYWHKARVIAATAAVVPQAALDLAAALRELARSAALRPDDGSLQPHVTVMRGVPAGAWRQLRADSAGETAATGPVAVTGWAASGQCGLAKVALQARELHLAESLEAPHGPAGRDSAGRLVGARRYATLARWPLRP